MFVESITEVSKERSRVVLDTGESFILYKSELRLLRLKDGSELPDDKYKQIMTVVLPKRAKLRAMNLLKARRYTEYMMRLKLHDGGYPDAVTEAAIEYVKSYGYIDDRSFAKDFIEYESASHSKREIVQKLQQKGISKALIEDVYSELIAPDTSVKISLGCDEAEVIAKTLKKRGFTGNETYEERQKLLAYFYRRGFDMDKVYSLMDSLR